MVLLRGVCFPFRPTSKSHSSAHNNTLSGHSLKNFSPGGADDFPYCVRDEGTTSCSRLNSIRSGFLLRFTSLQTCKGCPNNIRFNENLLWISEIWVIALIVETVWTH